MRTFFKKIINYLFIVLLNFFSGTTSIFKIFRCIRNILSYYYDFEAIQFLIKIVLSLDSIDA